MRVVGEWVTQPLTLTKRHGRGLGSQLVHLGPKTEPRVGTLTQAGARKGPRKGQECHRPPTEEPPRETRGVQKL